MAVYIVLTEHGDVYKMSSDKRAQELTEAGYLVINVTEMKVMLMQDEIEDNVSPNILELPDSENS